MSDFGIRASVKICSQREAGVRIGAEGRKQKSGLAFTTMFHIKSSFYNVFDPHFIPAVIRTSPCTTGTHHNTFIICKIKTITSMIPRL